MSKSARSGLSRVTFRWKCREATSELVSYKHVSIYRFVHWMLSDALSIQSYGTRPQAETLEVVLRSAAGLKHGQERTVHLKTFVGRGTRESHTLCPPRGGCEKPPRESDGT